MIGRLTGLLAECLPGRVVLDVAGVGYDVEIPLSTFYRVAERVGKTVTLEVHTHVREESLTLFGFSSQQERAMFRELIAISGVGPRVALAILSGIGADELERAVLDGDRARLQKIPGVGRKTAERLLLELGDRLRRRRPRQAPALPEPAAARDGVRGDAVSALINLGYAEDVARRAVDEALAALEGDAGLDTVLRNALGGLLR